jgi:multidrug efflux pump subunit AcrB
MRFVTLLLLLLTVVAGFLSYYGIGGLTDLMKLTYAYLALSTIASALVSLTMRPAVAPRVEARNSGKA